MTYHERLAQKILRTCRVWRWLTTAIHLVGSAALFIYGFMRSTDAIPTILLVFVPLILITIVVLRYGGERRTYTHVLGMDPQHAAHQLAAESHHRKGRSPIQDALWWLRDYITNVMLTVAVGLAVDSLGAPMAVTVFTVCGMLVLCAAVNALHFRMRLADALLTLTLWPERDADTRTRPTEGN